MDGNGISNRNDGNDQNNTYTDTFYAYVLGTEVRGGQVGRYSQPTITLFVV